MALLPSQLVIGVDLGGTTVKTGVVAGDGSIVYQTKLPSRGAEGPAEVISQIEASVHEAIKHANGKTVTGIGIGAPGMVNDLGVVQAPPNLNRWDAVPLKDEMQKLFNGMTIAVENDANAAALAEAKFGAGRQFPNFLFVIWGTGVGGGIILNGKIYRGASGGAGEIGHISIDYKGPQCNCGARGCVEAYVGQRYLSSRTAERLKDNPSSKILDLVGGDVSKIEPFYIAQAAHDGDKLAKEILLEASHMLGVALGAVMNTLDLRISVLGGGISAAGDFAIRTVEESVRSHVLKPLRKDIRVVPAQLGNNAGILGAAGLVL
ncbi:MAG: ROK family protein [Ignavibacteriae bacterium]|nr:ROK family protein [Ignavibacteriota bacterium]